MTIGSRSTVAGTDRRPSSRRVSRNWFASLPLLQNGRTYLKVQRYTIVCSSGGTVLLESNVSYPANRIRTLDLGYVFRRTLWLKLLYIEIRPVSNITLLGPLLLCSLLVTIRLQTPCTLRNAPGSLNAVEPLLESLRKSPVSLSNCPRGLLVIVVLNVLETLPCAARMVLTEPASRTLVLTSLTRHVSWVTGGNVVYSDLIRILTLWIELTMPNSLSNVMVNTLRFLNLTFDWHAEQLPSSPRHLLLVVLPGPVADDDTVNARCTSPHLTITTSTIATRVEHVGLGRTQITFTFIQR